MLLTAFVLFWKKYSHFFIRSIKFMLLCKDFIIFFGINFILFYV